MKERLPDRFANKIIFTKDCWLWKAAVGNSGYGKYRFGKKQVYAHRYSWSLFFGEIPAGMEVLHKCDVRTCVNPKHLFLGTQKENMEDKVKKGREARGEDNGFSKLTKQEVEEIRQLYVYGSSQFSQRALAKKYKVHQKTIFNIVNNKMWK